MRIVAMALLAATGCSFGQPGSWKPTSSHRIDCTDDPFLPIADSVVGAAAVAGVVGVLATAPSGSSDVGALYGLAVLGGVALATTFGISAGGGFKRTGRCRAANTPRLIETRRITWEMAQLTNEATQAAHVGDCEAVKKLGAQVNTVAPHFHKNVFRKERLFAACFAAPAPSPPAIPHCFDDTAENEMITICLPSRGDCESAIRMLPASDPPRTCSLHEPTPAATP